MAAIDLGGPVDADATVGGAGSDLGNPLLAINADDPADAGAVVGTSLLDGDAGNAIGGLLDGGTLPDTGDLLNGVNLDNPLLGADLSGPVDGTAVVGGDTSEVDNALITADADAPPIDSIGTDLLDGTGVGDTVGGLIDGVDTGPIDGIDLGNPLIAGNVDDTTLVLPGNESDFDNALITFDADTPADSGVLNDTAIGDTLNGLVGGVDTGPLDTANIGDTLNGLVGGVDTGPLGADLGNPLVGANLDDTTVVLPGDEFDFGNALITADANTPTDLGVGGTDLGNLPVDLGGVDVGGLGDLGGLVDTQVG